MKASVCCITYNHEKYIAQALDGFFLQQTDFDFEIVIADDASRDGTRSIIESYMQRYPGRINYIRNEPNMGVMPNFTQALKACRGEYVAICEGDDYWTDPNKLQIQSDLLDSKPGISFCFHKAEVYNETEKRVVRVTNENQQQTEFTTSDLIEKGWFIMTASIMFRNSAFNIPEWFSSLKYGDHPLQLLCSLNGNARFIDRTMSVYRVHNTGITNNFSMVNGYLHTMHVLDLVNRMAGNKFSDAIQKAKSNGRRLIMEDLAFVMKQQKFLSASYWKNYRLMLKYANYNQRLHIKYLLRFFFGKLGYKKAA